MEILAVAALVVAVRTWHGLFAGLGKIRSFRGLSPAVFLLAASPILSLAVIFAVLQGWSSHDVRGDPWWLAMYLALGAAWLGLGLLAATSLGIDTRGDAIERRNGATVPPACASIAAVSFCYAGANIGEGPGPEVVFFCALLSTVAFAGAWFLLESCAPASESITIDRDAAAGVRLAGWLLAVGLVSGAAVAGDWQSVGGTLRDFAAYAWAILPLLAMAVVAERGLPARARHSIPNSVALAAGYVSAAILYLRWKGTL